MTRRRVISDPREIAGYVLGTPGLVDKLVDALADVNPGLERAEVRGVMERKLTEMAAEFAAEQHVGS